MNLHLSILSVVLLICARCVSSLVKNTKKYATNNRFKVASMDTGFREMNIFERLGRAASFYSAALPVFASYKLLEQRLSVLKNTKFVSEKEEEEEYRKLHEWGSDIMTAKIKELRGFYVKTGQIISTRVDIFPKEYTSKLAVTQDALDPIPTEIIKEIVRKELLEGAELSELFLEFSDEPLGSASIAQVHKAKLLDGRIVAVKVQRPGIDAKLLGDIGNLKNFAKLIGDALPIDYYKIFCELEKTLKFELDFFHEAQSAQKVAAAVSHSPSNKPRKSPVIVPLPLSGLVSRRVLVMEFVDGTALSKLSTQSEKKGIKPGSVEALLFGRKLLSALTDAYASMIFGSGIIHGDPHPGNIFVTEAGDVALLDCGQVKQLTSARRLALARLLVLINEWEKLNTEINELIFENDGDEDREIKELKEMRKDLSKQIMKYMSEQEIQIKEGAGDECAVALALLLFGNSETVLPGGYTSQELSSDSPIAQVINFPSEFILLGRATVMIKGIAKRLGIEWGLASKWSEYAREALQTNDPSESLPIWSVVNPTVPTTQPMIASNIHLSNSKKRIRLKEVVSSFMSSLTLLQVYIQRKFINLFIRIVPEDTRMKLLRNVLKIVALFLPKPNIPKNQTTSATTTSTTNNGSVSTSTSSIS